MIQLIFNILIIFVLFIGSKYIYQGFFKKKKEVVVFRKKYYQNWKQNLQKELNDSELDQVLKEAGMRLTAFQYNLFRSIIIIMLMLNMLSKVLQESNLISPAFIIMMFIITTYPEQKFMGYKTPFAYIISYLTNRYNQLKNLELYRALMQLKNIAIAQKEKPLGADYIITKLMQFTHITKPTFAKTLNFMRMGREEQARRYFFESINTELAKEFANIIIKLDRINPVELVEQIKAYQEYEKQKKLTKRLQNEEYISYLIYTPIVANVMVIILNFIILFWLDTMSLLPLD